MSTYSPSGRPPWAATVWCDYTHIYVELPVKDGPPFITKHSLTEGGLGKALASLRNLYAKREPGPKTYSLIDHPKTVRPKTVGTVDQRKAALNILKKLGVV